MAEYFLMVDDDTLESAPVDGERGEFLARFLEVEVNLYRYVCVAAPVAQDARDIVQETALALWEGYDRYNGREPFLPWALGVAKNKIRQHAAKVGRFPTLLEDEELLDLIVSEQAAEDEEASERRRAHLRECVEKLGGDHARLIQGYYWKRASIDELAAGLRMSVEAAYKRLQRIRAILLECITRLERKEARES